MIYFGSAIAFLFFAATGAISARYFNFQGPTWYFFMTLMGTLGLTSSALFYYLQNKFYERKAKREEAKRAQAEAAVAGGAPAPAPAASETQQWVKEANTRLGQSKPGVGIENLPMIFVTGDRGTAKTSIILNSGLEPELLAGQLYQDNAVAPTRGANIFFARDNVFVEAGGTLMANPASWKALVTKLRPGRLKSLGKNTQAPRGVMLCFDLETFTRQGAADSVVAAARYLHERLGEVSQVLGISFPVYVLFTRADRLPFFAEFCGNLTLEEAGQVVGVTLPLPSAATGVYAEAATQRLMGAFDAIFYSFCDQRLRLMPREIDPMKVPNTYEFPREFRKLRSMLVQFLVDVGRPSQLRASPFLRGFYFSGVRPVQVQEAPVQAAATQQPQQEMGGGATKMFRVGYQEQQKALQAYAQQWAGSGSKKVPQWLFLGHLFNDVILADNVSRAASGSSIKTSLTKRILMAIAAALCLLYAALLTISYFGNRSLEQDAIVAARGIGPGEATGLALPTEEALKRLDTLRQSLQTLTDYERDGAPLSIRWGLYAGSSMLPHVRRVYYNKFRQLLFGTTQDRLLTFLQQTPPVPGPTDDYSYAYDTLKAYLLTTGEWKRSSDKGLQEFLASRLMARWSQGRDAQIGKPRLDLAKLQFDFYARDLQNGNPYAPTGDQPSIDRSRLYLSKFTGIERVYRFLLSESAKNNPPMNFNGKFPGSNAAVTSTVDVAWAYTREGWKFVQDQIRKQNYAGEAWVLGPFMGLGLDKATMERGIMEQYTKDYVEQWRRVLRGSRVNGYANAQDASKKLDILTSNNAPLLALFWWTTYHTAVADLPGVPEKFKPVHVVVPYSPAQQYVLPSNAAYNTGLISLKQAVDRVVNREPDADRGMRDSAAAATATTKQLSQTFPPEPEGRIDQRSEELLLQPIRNLEGLIGGDLRSGGAAFCTSFSALTNRFPFNPTANPAVTLEELADILQPNTGKLWTFYNNTVKSAMSCQNGQCTPTGNPPLNPTFVQFFGLLMQFSRALYGDAGNEPRYSYSLRPQTSDQVDSFDITVNGQAAQLKGGAQRDYVWPGPAPRNFHLTLRLAGGTPFGQYNVDELWAVFRFFADADQIRPTSGGYTFGWGFRSGQGKGLPSINGRPLTYEVFVDTKGAPAVFSKDFLSKLRCVGPLAR